MKRVGDSLLTTAGLLVGLAILAGIAFASYLAMNRFAAGARWIEHTHLVIQNLESMLSEVKDAETGQRGFLIVDDEKYLAPYYAARKAIPEQLQSLKDRTADNHRQRQLVATLENLVARRLEVVDAGIALRRSGMLAAAADPKRLAQGDAMTEGLRTMIAGMQAEEGKLLEQRSVAFERDRLHTALIIVIGNLVALAFLLLAFGVMKRQIAQRRQAEASTRRHAAEVEDLYNNAPCGYHSLDAEGRFVQINDTELRWLGYRREEMIGKMTLPDVLTSHSKQQFADNFAAFKREGSLLDVEYEMVCKDGTLIPVSSSGTLVRDEAGNYLRSLTTLYDISRRREAEQNLHRANAFLDSVFEHIPHMIFVKDAAELRFVRLNKAGEELVGYPKEALIGKNDYDFFPREQAEAFVAKDRQALAAGSLVDIQEEPIHTRVHGVRLLHTKKIPIVDERGNPRYLLGISEDITDRKGSERRIMELNEAVAARAALLEASNRELESFSYSVSHDLRSPLRAIDGFSRILQQDHAMQLDAEGRRLLAVVRTSSARMGRLIDDLLAFSRMGRQPMKVSSMDMGALAQQAFNELAPEYEGAAPQVSIGTLPDSSGDPVLLRQVWLNLLSNAVKYSRTRERPVVEVSGQPVGRQIVYCVKDNGVGFDMKYYDKLFGVFQRLHSADDFPGTGVGLAIVQRVVLRHGGRVWAESELDRGAAFYFSLPKEAAHE